jgi:O-antigen/teichoic acid export membrane protein
MVARGINQGCSLIRNVIVARIIGVENYGVAVTFSITVSIFDMLGSLSVDRLLIQAKDGNNPEFQATGHSVQVMRGITSGLLIATFASPLARLFGIPQATWAFYYLALLPVIRGFAHLDFQRIQREMRYGPSIAIDIMQQALPALLAWPISKWTRDYSAMLWLVLLQGVIGTLGSFVLSNRPYRWAWHTSYVKRFFSFGWPLIANAVLLFGIYDGDRFLMVTAGKSFGSHSYSMGDLGVYSVATSLTLSPMIAFGMVCSALMLPAFSSLQSNRMEFNKRYEQSVQLVGLISGFFALPLILGGAWFVRLVYGHQYAAAGAFIGWMAAAQAIRMARMTPAMAAMALGDTTNSMYANLVRFSTLLFTAYVVLVGGSLSWIAISGFIGEFLSLLVCIAKLSRDHRVSAMVSAKSTGVLLIAMALGMASFFFLSQQHPFVALGLIPVCLALFVALTILAFPHQITASRLKSLYEIVRQKKSPASAPAINAIPD